MRMIATGLVALLAVVSSVELANAADVKLQLNDVHICCGACVRGIQAAIKGIDATVEVDRDGGAVRISAPSEDKARQVVDAIAAAGYHGESDHATIKMKNDSGAPSGKVKRLKLGGIHNCCQGCTNAIVDAFTGVPGVQAHTLKNKQTEFVIEGDFDAGEVIKAIYAAGFHAKAVN